MDAPLDDESEPEDVPRCEYCGAPSTVCAGDCPSYYDTLTDEFLDAESQA